MLEYNILQAFVRQADAFSAMGNAETALAALSTALRLDPSLRRSRGFQVLLCLNCYRFLKYFRYSV